MMYLPNYKSRQYAIYPKRQIARNKMRTAYVKGDFKYEPTGHCMGEATPFGKYGGN